MSACSNTVHLDYYSLVLPLNSTPVLICDRGTVRGQYMRNLHHGLTKVSDCIYSLSHLSLLHLSRFSRFSRWSLDLWKLKPTCR